MKELHVAWQSEIEGIRRMQLKVIQRKNQILVATIVFLSPIPSIDVMAMTVLNSLMIKEIKSIWGCNWSPEILDKVSKETMVGGASLTKLLGTSAWYAPGASVSYLVDSILNNQRRMIPCSVLLNGEYGQKDICIGVPCIIGSKGVESIVELKLNTDELNLFNNSSNSVRSMNQSLIFDS